MGIKSRQCQCLTAGRGAVLYSQWPEAPASFYPLNNGMPARRDVPFRPGLARRSFMRITFTHTSPVGACATSQSWIVEECLRIPLPFGPWPRCASFAFFRADHNYHFADAIERTVLPEYKTVCRGARRVRASHRPQAK